MTTASGNSPFFSGKSGGDSGGSSVPAPPPEVKVRTFKSDVESMMQSGGGAPQYQSVRGPVATAGSSSESEEKKSWVTTIIVVVIGAILLLGIGYFAYRILSENSTRQNSGSPPPPPPSPLGAIAPPFPSTGAVFVHRSFFKKPVDQLLPLTVPVSAAANASDLATFSQRVKDVVNSANVTSNFFEIVVKDERGNDLVLSQILQATDIAILNPDFMNAHFLSDATLFVSRDASGMWPGLVFGLKSTENWLFIQNDVAKLESSPKIANLFVADPGTPAPGGFRDVTEAGQHARMLTYSAPRAVIVYGLFHNYFVISTSEDGLKLAIARLVE